ncbi:MAG: GTPase ObgE [Alphaproteobacteria bacterium]|nr:GTPase ObgE [Alphaproteobacteria bacterium]MDA7983526.1 GTPase ObgE [Alphaproteobacteria bacterium]
MRFFDETKIWVAAGNGGSGCVSFRRAANLPRGGPDGGNGGNGGDVWGVGDAALSTLADFRHRPHWKAGRGAHGSSAGKRGRDGAAVTLTLPLGTEIWDETGAHCLADLLRHGQRARLAAGGRGGRGNLSYKSSVRRAPRDSSPPQEGERRCYLLRLRLIGDVGLVGQPNAGKSSLLARMSAARPRVAEYPFTTTRPHLGVVEAPLADGTPRHFVMADVPGLLEGASGGVGLGLQFLRHLDRCRLLLHVVDASGEDPLADFAVVRGELGLWRGDRGGESLLERSAWLALNKCDLLGEGRVAELAGEARRVTGLPVFCVSAKTGEGCDGLGVALAADLPEEELDAGAGDIDLSLSSASDAFTVTPDNSQWD